MEKLDVDGEEEEEKEDSRGPKRSKHEYKKFEEVRLRELKEEYPKMKLSQYKEMVWKEWLKIQKKAQEEQEDN